MLYLYHFLLLIQVSIEFLETSSRLVVFYKEGVRKPFVKFTGKHLYWSLFFDKVAGLKPVALLIRHSSTECFPVNFVNLLRTPILKNIRIWLLPRKGKPDVKTIIMTNILIIRICHILLAAKILSDLSKK